MSSMFSAADSLRLLTPKELGAALQVSVGTIYYWVCRNEIPFIKVGRHLRFRLPEVIEFFAKRSQPIRSCLRPSNGVIPTNKGSLKTRDAIHADLRKEEAWQSYEEAENRESITN
jgi:excisionase family DNA binding protein